MKPPLPPRLAWALTLTATFTMSVSYVDRQTLAVLAPSFTGKLAIDDTHYGFLLSAFSIAYLIGAPLAGRWIDRVGVRRGLLIAVLVWSGVAALHAILPDSPVMFGAVSSFAVLFGLRIALGLAEAPSFPGAAQTVQRALPPNERARGTGILFTGSSIGAMVAPPLASLLKERWSWQAAFLGTALIGLVWVPIWLAVAYDRRAGAALDLPAEGGAPRVGARELLRNKAAWRGVALVLAAAPLLGFHNLWLSKLLTKCYGSTQLEIGYLLILPTVIFDVGAVAFGWQATRAMKRSMSSDAPPYGLVTIAAIIAMTGAFVPACPTPLSAMLLAGVSMAGGGGLYALNTADVLRRVPPSAVSTAAGLLAAAQSVALIISSPLVGRSVQWLHVYSPVLLVLALWHVPGVAVWLLVRPPPVHRESAPIEVQSS